MADSMTTLFPEIFEDEAQQADLFARVIVLSQGTLSDGRKYYAYLSMPPSKYTEFKIAEAKGNYLLKDYGEIIKFGYGDEPPIEIKQEMADLYGI